MKVTLKDGSDRKERVEKKCATQLLRLSHNRRGTFLVLCVVLGLGLTSPLSNQQTSRYTAIIIIEFSLTSYLHIQYLQLIHFKFI